MNYINAYNMGYAIGLVDGKAEATLNTATPSTIPSNLNESQRKAWCYGYEIGHSIGFC